MQCRSPSTGCPTTALWQAFAPKRLTSGPCRHRPISTGFGVLATQRRQAGVNSPVHTPVARRRPSIRCRRTTTAMRGAGCRPMQAWATKTDQRLGYLDTRAVAHRQRTTRRPTGTSLQCHRYLSSISSISRASNTIRLPNTLACCTGPSKAPARAVPPTCVPTRNHRPRTQFFHQHRGMACP
jgi:hypothetical protein